MACGREIEIDAFLKKVVDLARKEGASKGMVERVGEKDPFLILVSCILSLRTKDELTEVKAGDLMRHASSPREMIALGPRRIAEIIYPVGFYRRKAAQIVEISKILVTMHGGKVPDTLKGLLDLPGVGRKTANLVVSVGFGKPGICVDTHVHRVVGRWGYVSAKTPEKTEAALRGKLPRRWWRDINHLLVFFGKTVCTPLSPRCSTCPLVVPCQAVGVGRKR